MSWVVTQPSSRSILEGATATTGNPLETNTEDAGREFTRIGMAGSTERLIAKPSPLDNKH
jgi:hypothetical protein